MLRFCLVLLAAFTSGCASYHTHYAMFPAENSAGESRQIRVSWQSADYPDWWIVDDKATALRVETQCSDRVWKLRDDTDPKAGSCGAGIRACGERGLDVEAESGQPVAGGVRCMAVEPSRPDAGIAGIEGKLELLVACAPLVTSVGEGDEMRNLDYLRASSVPYAVHVRKAPRGSLRAKMPEFDQSACDAQ